ncbi:glycosyltransferase [Spirulina sp. 06S082]|uniref:glycosyltransferase n=1 Tax=Spirulina sp. 06S082 TaxID=3110248 RepID=UPI002B20C9E0|nr:glycosyltransferase [Spirulina sp. 06S082]MEA5469237.1 glycosyltransferase [Spirulina sp. 06S082]
MNANKIPKIVLFYPLFMGGGAEAVGLWILEALKEDYDLTLFTLTDIDLDEMNSMYGTQLTKDCLKIRVVFDVKFRKLIHFLIVNNELAKILFFHIFIRVFKKHCSEYDLPISGYNATDLGKKGIQYIHWIKVIEGNALAHKISDFSLSSLKNNVCLVNSRVVGETVKDVYGCESTVVYPPVVLEVQDIPWESKENAFICSGRLAEAKEPHRVIEILKQVRDRGFEIKLYLTGGGGGTYAVGYQRRLYKTIAENSDWITLYQNLPYSEYVKVLTRCKYGIHYKMEPFGISIAEMVKAGAITFVRRQGGQVEIVGSENEELLFSNPNEAVEKIVSVLSDRPRQESLVKILQQRNSLFSTTKFKEEIQQAIANYFATSI